MRFTADRAELAEAVKWVAGAISPKPSQPALAGIRMHFASCSDELTLTAHNYDQIHSAVVCVSDFADGDVVPAGLMVRDLLGALKTKRVDVEADDRRLTIKGGRSVYGVNLFTGWPEFPTGDATPRGTVDADDLRAGIAIAAAAADDDNPNEKLVGVRLEGGTDWIDLVGIQSSRIAAAEVVWDRSGEHSPFTARLPLRNLAEAVRGLTGDLSIASSDGILTLADARRSVTLRLYEAHAPDWRRLLERKATVDVEVDADELTAAVRRAALAGGKGGILAITVADGELVITGAGDEADGTEVVDVTGDGSYAGTWGADVLGSVLATLPSTPVTLSFETSAGGGHILAVTDKGGSFHHVVMGRKAQS